MSEENRAIVRRIIDEVWNRGNLPIADELVDGGYTGHDPNYPEAIRGPEGFKRWVSTARLAFPDFHITIEDLIAEGDTVVGRITMRGTNQGR